MRMLKHYACLLLFGLLAGQWEPIRSGLVWAQNGAPKPNQPAADSLRIYLQRLRNISTTDPLRGVRVSEVQLEQKRLRLMGFVEQEAQREHLLTEAERQLATMPKLRELATQGISADQITVLPIRSQSPQVIQKAFSERRFTDAEWEKILRQTRLDEANFDKDGGLVFRGVCLHSQAHQAMHSETGRPDLPAYRMIIEIEDLLQHEYTPAVFRKLNLQGNRVEMQFLESPVERLQAHVATVPELDGVLIRDAVYDERGDLKLDGCLGMEGQRNLLKDELVSYFKESAVWKSPASAQAAVSALTVFDLSAWRRAVQASLASSRQDALNKSRLERAWFEAPGRIGVQLRRIGGDPEDPEFLRDCRKLMADTTARLAVDQPEVANTIRDATLVAVSLWPDPALPIRTAVAREPRYDGLRIERVAIDSMGRLLLSGRCASSTQLDDFPDNVRTILKSERSPLFNLEIAIDCPEDPTSVNLLRELRAWSASQLEEVWLDRLYYTAEGELELTGTCVSADDESKCQEQGLALLKDSPLGQEPRVPLKVSLRVLETGLTQLLRNVVAESKKLRGLSIQRGSYNTQGEFIISGVQDNPKQQEVLTQLIHELSADSAIKSRLVQDIKFGDFVVVPVSDLIRCLNDVMPAFEAFDGIRLTDAFHDRENRLAFSGSICLRQQDRAGVIARAERSLLELIRADDDWKTRVGAGVSLTQLTAIASDSRSEWERRVLSTIRLIQGKKFDEARKILDTAIQMNPGDSLGWYLRATCCLSDARTNARPKHETSLLSARDCYRVGLLERRFPFSRGDRTRRLESLQGPLRSEPDNLIRQVLDRLDGGETAQHIFGIAAWRERNTKK